MPAGGSAGGPARPRLPPRRKARGTATAALPARSRQPPGDRRNDDRTGDQVRGGERELGGDRRERHGERGDEQRQRRTEAGALRAGIGDHETVSDARPSGQLTIRRADAEDVGRVAGLAGELAQYSTFSRTRFQVTYPPLLADDGACPLLAVQAEECLGYLLGFRHLSFYANSPAPWVEEVFVRRQERDCGTGRALMGAFEQWAAARGCGLIALATLRTAPFYRALGDEESAVYFRKVLEDQASE